MGAKTVQIFEVMIENYNLSDRRVLISNQNREGMRSIKRKMNKVDSKPKCRNKIHQVNEVQMEPKEN